MPNVGDPPVRLLSKPLLTSGEAKPIPAPMSLPDPEIFPNFS